MLSHKKMREINDTVCTWIMEYYGTYENYLLTRHKEVKIPKAYAKYSELIHKSLNKANFTKRNTLDTYIWKLGEKEGRKKYNSSKNTMKGKGTLKYYQEIYGEKEGKKRYLDKNLKLGVSVEALQASGKSNDEIIAIKNRHAKNSAITLENFKKPGISIFKAEENYKKYIDNQIKRLPSTVEYWTSRGFSIKEAKENITLFQAKNLEYYINKYNGILPEEQVTSLYKNVILAKIPKFSNSSSKKEIQLFNYVKNIVDKYKNLEIMGGDNKNKKIFSFVENKKLINIIPDIVLQHKKTKEILIIEFYGDYWHANPEIFTGKYVNIAGIKTTVKKIRSINKKKERLLKQITPNIIIIWENNYDKFKNDVLKHLKNKIIDIFNIKNNFAVLLEKISNKRKNRRSNKSLNKRKEIKNEAKKATSRERRKINLRYRG